MRINAGIDNLHFMRRLKTIFRDPGFYALLIWNVFILIRFHTDPEDYPTMLALFWCQSVLIGLDSAGFFWIMPPAPATAATHTPGTAKREGGCLAGIFLGLYGIFHLIYLVNMNRQGFGGEFFLLSLLLLLGTQLLHFLRHAGDWHRKPEPDIGILFLFPYLRILPIHFTQLLPTLVGGSPSWIFVLLRGLADLLGYIITTTYIKRDSPVREE